MGKYGLAAPSHVGVVRAGGQGFEPQPSDPESDVLPIKLSPITALAEDSREPAKTRESDGDIISRVA